MSLQQSRILLSTNYTEILAEYFPEDSISNRLMNWLYLALVLTDRKYELPFFRDNFTHPNNFVNELKKNIIDPDWFRKFRHARMFENKYFDWFEESEIFYMAIKYCIDEQQLKTIEPIPLNSRPKETSIMLFDGIDLNTEAKKDFLLQARKRWSEFKPTIKTINWANRGNVEKNIEALKKSIEFNGTHQQYDPVYFGRTDQYTDFLVYIFSLQINQQAVKTISTEAKKILRQSLPRKTKGKSQVNVSISDSTIEKLEKLCKVKKYSKARIITELIENYSNYKKEIDTAIQQANIRIPSTETQNPSGIMQAVSPKKPRRSDLNIDKDHTEAKEKNSIPDNYPSASTQRPYESRVSGSNNTSSKIIDKSHDVFVEKTAKPSPTTTKTFTNKPENEYDQNSIKIKFQVYQTTKKTE